MATLKLMCRYLWLWLSICLSFELMASRQGNPDWSAFDARTETKDNLAEAKGICRYHGRNDLCRKFYWPQSLNGDQKLFFSEIYQWSKHTHQRYHEVSDIERILKTVKKTRIRNHADLIRNCQPRLIDRPDHSKAMTLSDLESWSQLPDSAFKFLETFFAGPDPLRGTAALANHLSFKLLKNIDSKRKREFMTRQVNIFRDYPAIFAILPEVTSRSQMEFFEEARHRRTADFYNPTYKQNFLLRLAQILPHISRGHADPRELAFQLLEHRIPAENVAEIFFDSETQTFAKKLIDHRQFGSLKDIAKYRNQYVREFFATLESQNEGKAFLPTHLEFGFHSITNQHHLKAIELLKEHDVAIMIPIAPAPGQATTGSQFLYEPYFNQARAEQVADRIAAATGQSQRDEPASPGKSRESQSAADAKKTPIAAKEETPAAAEEQPADPAADQRFIVLGTFEAINNPTQLSYLEACLKDGTSVDEQFLNMVQNPTQVDVLRILQSDELSYEPKHAVRLALNTANIPRRVEDTETLNSIKDLLLELRKYYLELQEPVMGYLSSYRLNNFKSQENKNLLISMLEQCQKVLKDTPKNQRAAFLPTVIARLQSFLKLGTEDAKLCLGGTWEQLSEWLDLFANNTDYHGRDRVRLYIQTGNREMLEPIKPQFSRIIHAAPEDLGWFRRTIEPQLNPNSKLHKGILQLYCNTKDRSYFEWLQLDKKWQRELSGGLPYQIETFLLKLAEHPQFLRTREDLFGILNRVSSGYAWEVIIRAFGDDELCFDDDFFDNLELLAGIRCFRDAVILTGLGIDETREFDDVRNIFQSTQQTTPRKSVAKIAEEFGWADDLPRVIIKALECHLGDPTHAPKSEQIVLPKGTHKRMVAFVRGLDEEEQRTVQYLVNGHNRLGRKYFFCSNSQCLWPLHETKGPDDETQICPECLTATKLNSGNEVLVVKAAGDKVKQAEPQTDLSDSESEPETPVQTFIVPDGEGEHSSSTRVEPATQAEPAAATRRSRIKAALDQLRHKLRRRTPPVVRTDGTPAARVEPAERQGNQQVDHDAAYSQAWQPEARPPSAPTPTTGRRANQQGQQGQQGQQAGSSESTDKYFHSTLV